MARLFADENFPLPVIQELRALGHDVLTAGDIGIAGQATSDGTVLTFAAGDSCAILTLDRRDFLRLHAARPNHAGIILCTYDSNFVRQARRINIVVAAHERFDGQILRVNRPGPANDAT